MARSRSNPAPPPPEDQTDGWLARQGLLRPGPGTDVRPTVSIIVLTLDGEGLIDGLLQSFAAVNTYPNVQFIVVDHGSSDGTIELLRRWSKRLPIKIVSRGANYGFAASNNRAARLSRDDLLLFLNNDVVFTEDVVGAMVDVISDPGVGMVGLKQYQPAVTPSGRRVYHVGVRLGWNIAERRLRPYHVRPSAADALLANEVAAFPAVTASILLCRREEFLSVGGFCEDYYYGLEDVDLCCKVRWRLGKSVVSLNRCSALHAKNATRDRDPESRRPLEKANRRVLQQRCGFPLRRELLVRRVDDDGSFTGRRFTVGVAVELDQLGDLATVCPAAWSLGEALRQTCGWDVRYLPRSQWTRAAGLDLYLATSDAVDIHDLADAEPPMLAASWIRGHAEAWGRRPWIGRFDLHLCSTRALIDEAASFAGGEAIWFPPAVSLERFQPGPVRPGLEHGCVLVGDRAASDDSVAAGALATMGPELGPVIYGRGWEAVPDLARAQGGQIEAGELYRLLASAPLVVDERASRPVDAADAGVILQAVASGALALTDDEALSTELFDGRLPVWSSSEQLLGLVQQFRRKGDERAALARSLRDLVMERHGWSSRAQALHNLLTRIAEGDRIAIKADDADPDGVAQALATALRAHAPSVRIDLPDDWYSTRSIADDVVIAVRGRAAYRPASDQINVLILDEAGGRVPESELSDYDQVFGPAMAVADLARRAVPTVAALVGSMEDRARAVLEVVHQHRRVRMGGPDDPPIAGAADEAFRSREAAE